MELGLILEMAASGHGDRVAVAAGSDRMSYAELQLLAGRAGGWVREGGFDAVVYLGTSHLAYPVALFGATLGGVPLVPLNYRLGRRQLEELLGQHPNSLVVHGGPPPPGATGSRLVERDEFLTGLRARGDAEEAMTADPDGVAVVLYTSGTSAAPKAVLLRHRHLTAYLLASVEFAGGGPDEAALVSVPPYHVAGLTNLLSNLYAGRRIVYLSSPDPAEWLRLARAERVTQAMVVPTMLARIVDHLAAHPEECAPGLRTLSYGGARTPTPVIEKALRLFPDTGFVNAYGLTETSSTIALLGPDDHRAALGSDDEAIRARLGSAGRLLPGIEAEVRDDHGTALPVDQVGLVFLRGEQISGEYGGGTVLDPTGWFPTRDRGRLDADGYLFVEGR
ncbi:MAG: class I adenylate-forming enzyme family protein, partial [Acidimicrobiales bacterium]